MLHFYPNTQQNTVCVLYYSFFGAHSDQIGQNYTFEFHINKLKLTIWCPMCHPLTHVCRGLNWKERRAQSRERGRKINTLAAAALSVPCVAGTWMVKKSWIWHTLFRNNLDKVAHALSHGCIQIMSSQVCAYLPRVYHTCIWNHWSVKLPFFGILRLWSAF